MSCSGTTTDGDSGPAPDTGTPTECVVAIDCDDGVFCNGAEQCEPTAGSADAQGCVDAPEARCMGSQTCDEVTDECQTICELESDADGDGAIALGCGGDDCDDADPLAFPGGVEVCDADGRDEDCDPTTFGADDDGDGHVGATCCNAQADDTLLCGDDCDDTLSGVHPGSTDACNAIDDDCDGVVDEEPTLTFYRDVDGDDFGVDDMSVLACSAPPGYALTGGDCDDGRGGVNPGVDERCDDIDNNCDGLTDEGCDCTTGDERSCGPAEAGVGACREGTQRCVDGSWPSTCAGEVRPASEVCGGGDEDCDGTTDEPEALGASTYYRDIDDDGYGDPGDSVVACAPPSGYRALAGDCDDGAPGVNPAAPEACNEIDDDCDGTIDPGCSCTDGDTQSCGPPEAGVGDCRLGTQSCAGGEWGTCIGSVVPRAETCGGGDEDCDAMTDEAPEASGSRDWYRDVDDDGHGDAAAPVSACSPPSGYVASSDDCNDSAPMVNPSASESCNEIDDDCDGEIDPGCSCTNGHTQDCGPIEAGVGDCRLGTQTCGGGTWGSCIGSVDPRAEVCGGGDEDCDGTVDEAPEASGSRDWYRDVDDDGHGDLASTVSACSAPSGYVSGSDDCDDSAPAVYPGATEECNGVDDDCDGSTDPGCDCIDTRTQLCGPPEAGIGVCTNGLQTCVAGAWGLCIGAISPSPETCGGGDEDCDSSVDEGAAVGSTTYYYDGDDDMYGVAGVTVVACSAPPGYVVAGTDCNDMDASVNPGAAEACNLGVDDDCDGDIDEDPAAAVTTCPPSGGGTTYACASGACAVSGCPTGLGDCDSMFGNACEESLQNSMSHCGACANPCSFDCRSSTCDEPVALGLGVFHSCAVQASGNVSCWGHNGYGQIGDGTTLGRLEPVQTMAISDARQVVGGRYHSCLLTTGDRLYCWGRNQYSQTGFADTAEHHIPQAVGAQLWNALAAGQYHTCAVRSTVAPGAVYCFGRNDRYQLGKTGVTEQANPVAVPGVSNATAVGAGNKFSCARLSTGAVSCWGDNSLGQLGDGSTSHATCGTADCSSTPVSVSGVSNATALAVGDNFACVRRSTGQVSCWGTNDDGQLGDGSTAPSSTPVDIPSIADATAICAGSLHGCAIRASGQLVCWGSNAQGQLGDGTTTGPRLTPVNVVGFSSTARVACGADHTCAQATSGELRCWGANTSGMIGDGTNTRRPSPTGVSPLDSP